MKKILYIFIISVLFLTASVFAQNPQELRVGSFINGNLSAGQEIWYSVRATDAGILIVETSGDTDTYLEVYDAQRNYITENDDGPNGYNARIEIPAVRGAAYLFKLSGYDGFSSGPFRILASTRPLTELRVGSAYSGNIGSEERQWFSVRTAQNSILQVETSGDIDTILEAYHENLEFIRYDDDGGEGYNAKIEIVAKADSTYYFILTSYNDGSYRIIANTRNFPAPVQLNPGSFQSGNISSGQDYWYSVRTSGRGRLVVETTGSTDTMLEAFSESYEIIDADDDSGEELNARIEINAEPNRTYIFRLRGWSDTSGPYRIFASLQ